MMDMHQICHSNDHKTNGAPVESIPFALKILLSHPNCPHIESPVSCKVVLLHRNECRTLLTQCIYYTHLSMLFEGMLGNPVPTCALQMMAEVFAHRK